MSNRIQLDRMHPTAISLALERAGVSLWEFCSLFDLNYDTAKKWLRPIDHAQSLEPPYWVTPVLSAMADGGIGARFLDMATRARAAAGPPRPARCDTITRQS